MPHLSTQGWKDKKKIELNKMQIRRRDVDADVHQQESKRDQKTCLNRFFAKLKFDTIPFCHNVVKWFDTILCFATS